MNKIKLQNWIEIFGILAVIGSLIFVGIQIKQDQVIARSVLGAETFTNFADAYQTMADPNFSVMYAKMLNNPESLTDSEMLSINNFYLQVTALLSRSCYLVKRGVFPSCEPEIRDVAPLFFSNKYAQSWWKTIGPSNYSSSLPKWIDSYIAKLDNNSELDTLDKIKKALK